MDENYVRPRFNQETGERIIYDDEIVNEQPENQQIESQPQVMQAQSPLSPEQIPEQQIPEQQIPPQQIPPQQLPPQPAPVQKSGCSGCLKGCLITFIIFIVIVGLLAIGGYTIYKINQPKDVEYEEADIESFYDKIKVDNKEYLPSVEELILDEVKAEGQVSVDNDFSSAEVTAVIQDAANRNDYFKNVNVRFIDDDKVEVFATVSDHIDDLYELAPDLQNYDFVIDKLKNKKLYFVGDVTYDKETGFDLVVEELKVSFFKIPVNMINEYNDTVETLLNHTVDKITGLEIESLDISEDNLEFIGQVPNSLR